MIINFNIIYYLFFRTVKAHFQDCLKAAPSGYIDYYIGAKSFIAISIRLFDLET